MAEQEPSTEQFVSGIVVSSKKAELSKQVPFHNKTSSKSQVVSAFELLSSNKNLHPPPLRVML